MLTFTYSINRLFISIPLPSGFDLWGWNMNDERFAYSVCVMDDFGNLVPVDSFEHYSEGCSIIYAPDYENNRDDYVAHYPNGH